MIKTNLYNYETNNYRLVVVDDGLELKGPCYQIQNKETGVIEYEGRIIVNTFKIIETLQATHDAINEILLEERKNPALKQSNDMFIIPDNITVN